MKRYFFTMCMSACTLAASAQDWQIGGGADTPQTDMEASVSEVNDFHQDGQAGYIDLFRGKHDDVICALSIGYVNKYWSTDFGSYTWRENFWGEEGKRLHGVQIGLTVQPCLPMGLGIHSGLFYEGYFSVSNKVKEMGWDNFTESSLYLPLHAMYRIPFSYKSSLTVYGGLGFNWAIHGEYTDDDDYYDYLDDYYEYYHERPHLTQEYGREGWPRRFNVSTELGATLRIQNVICSFTYSHGMTNHRFYSNHIYTEDGHAKPFKTVQNKIGISVGILLNDDL